MEISTFTKLRVKKFPKNALSKTQENHFWDRFQNSFEKNFPGGITNFVCGNKKNNFAFSYSNIVEVYQTKKENIQYTLKKFKSDVTCVKLREDGKLLAVGENDGKIQLIETKKRDILRIFKNHKKSVYCAAFSNIEPILVSGSDDLSIKIFDIPTNELTRTYQNFHTDYIRGLVCLNNKNFLSSSYDQNAQIFDISSNSYKPELTFKHGSPIESIDFSDKKLIFASVGGLECKLWDVRNNKEPICTLSSNKKTLTCVKFVASGDRVFTSSLDHMLKAYSTEDFQLKHLFKLGGPINCFDLTSENTHLGVGFADGNVIIKKKNTNVKNEDDEEDKDEDNFKLPSFFNSTHKKRVRNYAYFYRGIYKTPESFDIKLQQFKNKKLTQVEKFLKRFQYKQALMTALESKKNEVISALLDELLQRGVINMILRKMNLTEIRTLLSFIEKNIIIGKFQDTIIEILEKILDEKTKIEEDCFDNLNHILEEEIENGNDIEEISGCLETIRKCQEI